MSLDRVLCINTEEKGKTGSPSQSLFTVNNAGTEIRFFPHSVFVLSPSSFMYEYIQYFLTIYLEFKCHTMEDD